MKRKLALLLSVILLVTSVVPMFIFEASAANAAPTVIPNIRSWTGGSGKFTPNASTVLVYNGTEASEQVKLVQEFFTDMLGITPAIKTSGTSNAIIFKTSASACDGKEEGYDLVATTSSITITASTKIGLLYGGITVIQSCYADGYFPVGTAKDYPAYPVRSGMVDVGRMYMPIEELTSLTKYMAWYKLNEIHVHLSDNGKNGYDAFRLESDIPNLTSKDGAYTKEEYKAFQKEVLKYGVNVVTEIDTPFHAKCFEDVEGIKFLTTSDTNAENAAMSLDIRDAKTVQIIKDMWTEYLGGDDPVIIKENEVVHIGFDEYPRGFQTYLVNYLHTLIRHVNSATCNSRIARFWSGLDATGGCLAGATFESDMKIQTNYWYADYSGPEETAAANIPMLNSVSNFLYIVPGSNEGLEAYEDHFNEESLKKVFNDIYVNRWSAWNPDAVLLPEGHKNMLGANFCIWNDWASAWIGLTYRDVLDRIEEPVSLMAEKNWCGSEATKTGSITYENFKARFNKLSKRAGNADPLNNKALEKGDIKVDFSATFPKTYTAASVVNGEYVLNGSNPISLGDGAVGFPNTLSFDLTLDELPAQRTAIFAGYDTCGMDIFVDPDGTLGLKSKLNEDTNAAKSTYIHLYDYKLSAGKKTNITFTCDRIYTTLIINGSMSFTPSNSRQAEAYTGPYVPLNDIFATLTIPLSKVGAGLKGKLDNISITNKTIEIPAGENIALNKTYTTYNLVDGVVTDENKISRDYAAKLTDGTAASTQVVADWFGFFCNSGTTDQNCASGTGYVLIDLGASYDITKIKVHVRTDNDPSSVVAYVSDTKDGTYTKAATLAGTAGGTSYWLSSGVSGVSGQYVKIEVKVDGFWALFNEIEVYGAAASSSSIKHDALNAPVSASRGFADAFTSGAGISVPSPSVLTDGYVSNSHSPTSGEWYVLQTWVNTEMTDGTWGKVGSVELDLGKETEIEEVKLHLANSTNVKGTSFTDTFTAPEKIEVFAYVGGSWQSLGTAEVKTDKDIVYWSSVVLATAVKTTKIRVDITLNAALNTTVWGGLMDEIAVYKAEPSAPPVEPEKPVEEKVEHIAVGKPTTVSGNFAGLTSSAGIVIGAPAILTDGSAYSLHDSISGNWMLYQTWLNSTTGTSAWGNEFVATIDLQGEYVIDSVKVHLANSQNFEGTKFTGVFNAPKSVEAFALVDGEWKSLGQFAVNTTDATYWVEVAPNEDVVIVATQIKVVTILDGTAEEGAIWGGLMDEIAVYGEAYVAPPETIDRLLGDVDGDGEVGKSDYVMLKRYCFDTVLLDDNALLAADVNQDNEVNKEDYVHLKRYCFDTMPITPEYIQVPVVTE